MIFSNCIYLCQTRYIVFLINIGWRAGMKIKEIITDELLERYQYRRRSVARRAAHRPIVRSAVTPKPVKAPAHRVLQQQPMKRSVTQPVKKPSISKIRTMGLNPKIDSMNGPNFKLDDRNILPQFEKNFGINDKSKG
jgi:hypothetical protein